MKGVKLLLIVYVANFVYFNLKIRRWCFRLIAAAYLSWCKHMDGRRVNWVQSYRFFLTGQVEVGQPSLINRSRNAMWNYLKKCSLKGKFFLQHTIFKFNRADFSFKKCDLHWMPEENPLVHLPRYIMTRKCVCLICVLFYCTVIFYSTCLVTYLFNQVTGLFATL